MTEHKTNVQDINSELELVYAHMPQNDKQQLEQIVREYESEPAKGLSHGVQKDAIQNAFGARVITDEVKACQSNWRCYFELIVIKGKEALVFWDEGTTGLTGEILSVDDIEKKSAEGLLGKEHANQRLARFLTRFESGGNIGPGSFGRGKLIFQGASKDHSILVDSLRSDDDKYIAFDRLVKGTQLKQQKIPFEGDKAERFIREATGGALRPLASHGTRIIILNVKDEITEAFKRSFSKEAEEGEYIDVFSRMIEETWWEIIDFGAKIILKYKGKEKQVQLTEPLHAILKAREKDKNYRVYSKNNISVVVDTAIYKIKHLKFVVTPNQIEDELREIWVQRKRMKIGSISKGITPHHKIQKNFTGYIILDHDLEQLFEEKESPTHYGFIIRGRSGGAITQVREVARNHLEQFHQQLGLRVQSAETKARQDMLDTLKELNEHANKLGLPTDFSVGPRKKDVEITIDSFTIPNQSSARVEIGDKVGPIVYRVINNTNTPQPVRVEITGEQRQRTPAGLLTKDIDMKPASTEVLPLEFAVNPSLFAAGEGLLIRARVYRRSSPPEPIHQVSRMLWIGMDPPSKPKDWVNVISYAPDFPRSDSRRVELKESIRNIHFKISSNALIPLKINLDLLVRKAKSPSQDVRELQKLITERGLELSPLADRQFAVSELQITQGVFGDIFLEAIDATERKCEIFFSVRAAENYPTLGKLLGDQLGSKKAISFFCGVDPPGMSIFKTVLEKNEPNDGKRSWAEGDRASGYSFVLNVGHSSYKLADELGDEFRKYHIREQMLFQAYLIAIEENVFKGPAEPFKDDFADENIEPIAATRIIDEIVGAALNQMS